MVIINKLEKLQQKDNIYEMNKKNSKKMLLLSYLCYIFAIAINIINQNYLFIIFPIISSIFSFTFYKKTIKKIEKREAKMVLQTLIRKSKIEQ